MTDKTNGTDVSSLKERIRIFIIPFFPKRSGFTTNLLYPHTARGSSLTHNPAIPPIKMKHVEAGVRVNEKHVRESSVPLPYICRENEKKFIFSLRKFIKCS